VLAISNCKINIGLNIIDKRADGFHNIETVFYPVEWCDVIEVTERSLLEKDHFSYTDGLSLKMTGLEIEGNEDNNLCVRAFQLLRKDFNLPDVVMHLHKLIPMGAGLGGGSSNAAHTLRLLNVVFKLKLTNEQLKNYAAQLGSDCSFFIENKPCFASGKGELISAIKLDLSGKHITIIKPYIHVSTVEAYQNIVPSASKNLKSLILEPIENWKANIVNDFEEGVFKKHPQIAAIKQQLYDNDCIYASISGSGSAVYGISDNKLVLKKSYPDTMVWQGILN
jgi:4-diphosphocytidyl-2-C-methyl-D-erythritol kinase